MRHFTFLTILLLSVAVGMTSVVGCSLIGAAIGGISDSKRQKTTVIPGWEVASVKPGTNIQILGKNGHHVEGLFTGIQSRPLEEYAASFEASSRENPELDGLPSPGDSVTVTYVTGAGAKGVLIGYNLNSVTIRVQTSVPARSVSFTSLATFQNSEGTFTEPAVLSELIHEGKLPVLTAISFVADSERRSIAVNDVDQITYRRKTNGAITGFLIGAAIDTGIILAIKAEERREERRREACRRDPNCISSCPLVYSFDGEGFVLDSETYGGAIFKAGQRTDLDNLDYLKAVEGTYRLSLRNESDETEYVDKLSLLAIDHAPGSRVVPTFEGSLHVISDPQSPDRAVDRTGVDILTLISATDDNVWVSNPLNRDPGNVESARDRIEVEFERHPGKRAVKLLVNVQNTWWVPFLARKVLRIQGRDLENWYTELNSSPEARSVLMQAIIREGTLTVEVWNGSEWRYGGFVWEVGPSLAKDLVVVLDLTDVESDRLKIRLSSTAGLWMINSVQADYSENQSLEITEIFPESAVTHTGEEITEILTNEDSHYYVMPTKQDRAELVFIEPVLPPGLERTVILSTSGWYKIHINPEGDPQIEYFTRLMTEPGAISEFSVMMMNEMVQSAIAELPE